MIGCLRTRVHKQPVIVLYFESKTVLKLYDLEASYTFKGMGGPEGRQGAWTRLKITICYMST